MARSHHRYSDDYDDSDDFLSDQEYDDPDIAACERVLGYTFDDKSLLEEALTHSSGAISRSKSNERLEFLGDSVLGLTICTYLFCEYPEFQEGEMTKIKSIVVSRQTCALVSQSQGIGRFLHLGRGMTQTGQGMPMSLLANLQEAIIGAIYLDSDFETAQDYVERFKSKILGAAEDNFPGVNYCRKYKFPTGSHTKNRVTDRQHEGAGCLFNYS